MKNIIFYLSLLLCMLISFTASSEQESETFSDAELAQMLAPIALYPDSLLTHILIASTYPIEVIEAHRWLKKNDSLKTKQQKLLLADFDWDASVKALIPFERVLSRLSENLSWTRSLGDAFLQDESRLLSSIQDLRKQAKLSGSLSKMDTMDIDYEDNNISIRSREKEVVYVPYYDSRMVYGSWFWSAYPPVYWHPHHSVNVSLHSPFHWRTGVHISFNYFFSAFHWHNRHVVVVNPKRGHYRYSHQRPRRLVANGGYAKRWSHQPSRRKGVAYRTKRTSEKYYGKRNVVRSTYKQFDNSHHNFKQKLTTPKHVSNKAKYNIKHKESHKTAHKTKTSHKAVHQKKNHKTQQRQVLRNQSASQQKTRNRGNEQSKQRRQVSQKMRQKNPMVNKRVESSSRKNQHRSSNASSHKPTRNTRESSKRHSTKVARHSRD